MAVAVFIVSDVVTNDSENQTRGSRSPGGPVIPKSLTLTLASQRRAPPLFNRPRLHVSGKRAPVLRPQERVGTLDMRHVETPADLVDRRKSVFVKPPLEADNESRICSGPCRSNVEVVATLSAPASRNFTTST